MPSFAKTDQQPSSNWLALQKKLPVASTSKSTDVSAIRARKRRKLEEAAEDKTVKVSTTASEETSFVRGRTSQVQETAELKDAVVNGESLAQLRKMIAGEIEFSEAQQLPGKYLAVDCEMVGVGINGEESSLARVSMVNYHGAVQLDVFVRQREHVVDYRTQYSGIRPSDMVHAKPFAEVQQQVADLLKDRILVGHAVHNDLKALLLSHPRPYTRDTQIHAAKHKLTRSKRIALRKLVQQELGVAIQEGEHSSVTDARATIAVFRLHRKEWEKGQRPHPQSDAESGKKRKRTTSEDDARSNESPAPKEFSGGGRKAVSSGLSTIIKRREQNDKPKSKWWKELAGGSSKSSLSLKVFR